MTYPPRELAEPDLQRQAPEDPDAERDVIGSALLGGVNTLVDIRNILSADDFTRWQGRLAFEAMVALADRGEKIDVGTVRSEADRLIEGHPSRTFPVGVLLDYLIEAMASVPTHVHAASYARRIRSVSIRRKMMGVANELMRIALVGPSDGSDETMMGRANATFQELLTGATSNTLFTAEQLADRHYELLMKREAKDPSVIGLPTGFQQLDEALAYFPGELWYVAARPGIGKTAILKDLQMRAAHHGVPTMFVSVEQPERQIMDRTMASMAKVDSWKIQKGQMTFEEWQSIWKANADFRKLPVTMIDDTFMTTAKLDAAVRAAKAKHDIKVVFLDYIGLLADEYGNSTYERVTYVSRRLAQIARANEVTIVSACQLSRQSDPGELPHLDHLRDSGGLEQDAFVVLGLARKDDIIRIGVLKNRNGKSNIVMNLYYNAATLKFNEIIAPSIGAFGAVTRATEPAVAVEAKESLAKIVDDEVGRAVAAVDRTLPIK